MDNSSGRTINPDKIDSETMPVVFMIKRAITWLSPDRISPICLSINPTITRLSICRDWRTAEFISILRLNNPMMRERQAVLEEGFCPFQALPGVFRYPR
jgi:hypothetical protein